MCVIGFGTVVLFSIASYNQKELAYGPICLGIGLMFIGWLLTKYVVKKTGRSIIHILLEFF
jgi:hypothetical protein